MHCGSMLSRPADLYTLSKLSSIPVPLIQAMLTGPHLYLEFSGRVQRGRLEQCGLLAALFDPV